MSQRRRPAIGLIGPMLGRHPGWVVSQGEILAPLFTERGHDVVSTSDVRAPLLRNLDMVWTMLRRRRGLDIAVVMVFSGRGFASVDLVSRVAKALGLPLVYCLRGGNLPAFVRRHPRWSARVMRRAALLVAPSRYLAEQLPDWNRPCTVIPNVVRLDGYPFRRRGPVAPRLLWMRTFHEIYHPELALEVLARVLEHHPDATLTMAGQDTGGLASVRRRTEALGLGGKVRFAGFLDAEAKRSEFAGHDVFLNTNRIDNMPVSVVEAAAFGLPVVATAVGGIPYLLQDEDTALLVPDDDAEAMTRAIERLLADETLAGRLSENGRRLAEASAWPAVAVQWDAAFDRVLGATTGEATP